ncbi:hypothetical protein BC936DRAFT_137604, partial [Jimgerdemannia flammicorona]
AKVTFARLSSISPTLTRRHVFICFKTGLTRTFPSEPSDHRCVRAGQMRVGWPDGWGDARCAGCRDL